MLWPGEKQAEQRDNALQAWIVDNKFKFDPPLPRSKEEQQEIFAIVRAAGPIEPFVDDATIAFRYGIGAGYLLQHAILDGQKNTTTGKPNFKRMKERLAANGFGSGKPLSLKTIDTHILPKYRRVSAYWAALIYQWEGDRGWPFPCTPSTLREFLALAEWFRITGEATQLRQSRFFALAKHEAIRVPPKIAQGLRSLQFGLVYSHPP
jgi:hypothetical protein